MLRVKTIVKTTSIVNKELMKFQPVAITTTQQQNRGYSDHKIPDRLQHVETAQNPKFFDMVIPISKPID